jgi:hypothetical protein
MCQWPNSDVNPTIADGHIYGLTDECAFWSKDLKHALESKATEWLNSTNKSLKVQYVMSVIYVKCKQTHEFTGKRTSDTSPFK